jgi:hypothetical protein
MTDSVLIRGLLHQVDPGSLQAQALLADAEDAIAGWFARASLLAFIAGVGLLVLRSRRSS